MSKDIKVEAEGGELVLRNRNGDIAIIPRKYRLEALGMIREGCHACLDDLISKLPRMENYAEDGTVIPNDKNGKNNDKKSDENGSNVEKETYTVYSLDEYGEEFSGYKIVVTNKKDIRREPKTFYVDAENAKGLTKERLAADAIGMLGYGPHEIMKNTARYSYYGRVIEPLLQNSPDSEFRKAYQEMQKEKFISKRTPITQQYLSSGNNFSIPLSDVRSQYNSDEEYNRFISSRDVLSRYYEIGVAGTNVYADNYGIRNSSLLNLNQELRTGLTGINKELDTPKKDNVLVKGYFEYFPEIDDIYFIMNYENKVYDPRDTKREIKSAVDYYKSRATQWEPKLKQLQK